MAKVCFQVLGCRLNQAEAEQLAQGFILAGHAIVQDPAEADVRVVHTCTVTAEAGRKSRKAARRGRPGQQIVVTGCHSELYPGEFGEAQLRVAQADKHRLVNLTLERFGMEGLALGMDYRPGQALNLYPLALAHTRAFVKIQDGCNRRCSFCLTTLARGASHCRPVDAIVQEIGQLEEQGCREAVLVGVHAGCYQEGAHDLGGLVEQILSDTTIPRLRLSSLEPWNFKVHWLRAWKQFEGRLCRHLHMSLQSGSDTVLARMRRGYTADEFARKLDAIREAVPGMAVTTDLIVGFPGETEAEHTDSVARVRDLALAGAHVFSFSARPGTEAAGMPDQLPSDIRRQRHAEMKAVTESAAETFRRSLIGQDVQVLWEQQESTGQWSGLTDTYVRISTEAPGVQANTLGTVRVTGLHGEGVRGALNG